MEKKVEELEDDLKVLKNEIKESLTDIREHLLTYIENPFAMSRPTTEVQVVGMTHKIMVEAAPEESNPIVARPKPEPAPPATQHEPEKAASPTIGTPEKKESPPLKPGKSISSTGTTACTGRPGTATSRSGLRDDHESGTYTNRSGIAPQCGPGA